MENLVTFKCLIRHLSRTDILNLALTNRCMYTLFKWNKEYILELLKRRIVYIKIEPFFNVFNYTVIIKGYDKVPDNKLDYYSIETVYNKIYIVFHYYNSFIDKLNAFTDKKTAQNYFQSKIQDEIKNFDNNDAYNIEMLKMKDKWTYSSSFFNSEIQVECIKEVGWVLCQLNCN